MNLLDGTYDGGGDGYDDGAHYDPDGYPGEEYPHSEHGDYADDASDFESHQLHLDGDEY